MIVTLPGNKYSRYNISNKTYIRTMLFVINRDLKGPIKYLCNTYLGETKNVIITSFNVGRNKL